MLFRSQRSAGAATWWWCGIFFRWGVSPSKKGSGHSYTRLLRTSRFIRINGIYIYLRRPPFLPYNGQLQYTTPTQHGNRTNRIRPRRSVMSLSFPTLNEQPGLTARYSALLYLNPPSYILVLLVVYYRGFMHPYEWLSALIGYRR